MVDLGKKLNVKVCAEGVEKKEQLEFFKNIGCDYVQGFLFTKPPSFRRYREKIFNLG